VAVVAPSLIPILSRAGRWSTNVIACVPVGGASVIDPRWGRADRLAIAEVLDGQIVSWQEFDVGWSRLHDEGAEGSHHARVVRFLLEHRVQAVVAGHMGDAMVHMLDKLGVQVHLGASGDAQVALRATITSHENAAAQPDQATT